MQEALILKIILSFAVAGTWITITTVIAERFGTKIGGLIGSMPANILVTMFFIGWTQGPEFAAEVVKLMPIGMTIDSAFLFIFILAAKKYGEKALLISIGFWFLLAVPLGFVNYNNMVVGSAIYLIITLALFYLLESKIGVKSSQPINNKKQSTKELLSRAILSGSLVASVVAIAAIAGPTWGGVFSVFPAVFTSTLYILTKKYGAGFSSGIAKTLLIASINIVVYALAVNYAFPKYGVIIGTVIAYVSAGTFVLVTLPFINRTN